MVIKIRGDPKTNRRKQEEVFGGEQVCKLKCLTHLFGDVWDCKSPKSGKKKPRALERK